MKNTVSRKEEREILAGLLFETEFRRDESVEDVFALSTENRDIPVTQYIKDVYFGVYENVERIDEVISQSSNGWKPERISKLSLSILRLCVYEMMFRDDIPNTVSINEAIELAKRFDDDRARPFINGILKSVMRKLEGENGTQK